MPHGTGATVSGPHEIVNVLGLKGFDYMRPPRASPWTSFPPSLVRRLRTWETAGTELDAQSGGPRPRHYPDAPPSRR